MNIRIYLLFVLCVVFSANVNPSVRTLDKDIKKRSSSPVVDSTTDNSSASSITTDVDPLVESARFQRKLVRFVSAGWKISNIIFDVMTLIFAYYGGQECSTPCDNEGVLSKMAIWSANTVLAGGVVRFGLFYALATLKMQMPWEYVPVFMMNILKMGIVSEFRWAFLAKRTMREVLCRTAIQLSQFDLGLFLAITALQHFNVISR